MSKQISLMIMVFFMICGSFCANDTAIEIIKEVGSEMFDGFNSISILIPDERGGVYVSRTHEIARAGQMMASGKGKVKLIEIGKTTEALLKRPFPDSFSAFITSEQPYRLFVFCQKDVRYDYVYKVVERYKEHFERDNHRVKVELRPSFQNEKDFQ